MSERLCLQWNDFKESAIGSLRSLRGEIDFHDVTLACEDGKQIEAHKVILSISSPFKRKRREHKVTSQSFPIPFLYQKYHRRWR